MTLARRSRPLVGVVGGGEQPDLARCIGQQLVEHETIVLTGGRGVEWERREAKDVTLQGAVEYANKSGKIARIVGILPRGGGQGPLWQRDRTATTRSLFVLTTLTSYQRDLINGVTPDVVIALRGGRGTLAEIGFAGLAQVPIVLADSDEFLRAKLDNHRNKLITEIIPDVRLKYKTLNGTAIDEVAFVGKLARVLGDDSNVVRFKGPPQSIEKLAAEIVLLAIARSAKAGSILQQRFPGLPGAFGSVDNFYAELQQLE